MKTPGPSKASSAAVFQFTVLRLVGGGPTASTDFYQMGPLGIYRGGPVKTVSSHVLKVAARFEVYLESIQHLCCPILMVASADYG